MPDEWKSFGDILLIGLVVEIVNISGICTKVIE